MPPRPEPLLEARGVGVRFPGAARDAVRDVSFALAAGERLALLGPSGSGKSTLSLALLGAIPHLLPGIRRGETIWAGRVDSGLVAGTGLAAAVLQDAGAQLVALRVDDELAFALENRGLAADEIERRVERALGSPPAAGLGRRDSTLALSGGWRQRLALAAALAESAGVLVIDEPVAHLDEAAAAEAIEAVDAATRHGGAAILVEHRADHVAALADRVLVLGPDGSPVILADTADALLDIARRPDRLGLRLPAPIRVAAALHGAGLLPCQPTGVGAADLVRALGSPPHHPGVLPVALAALGLASVANTATSVRRLLLSVTEATVVRAGRPVLRGIDLQLGAGEVVGLTGRNGAGKTTLGLLVAGALRARGGRVVHHGRPTSVYVPQSPALSFASPSLAAEAQRRRLPWADVAETLARVGLPADPGRHPLAFSHGEMRRLSIALALAVPGPKLVVMDEPTAGLDGFAIAALDRAIANLRAEGSGVLLIAHDLDWLASVTDRIVVLDAGRVVADAPCGEVVRRVLGGDLPLRLPPGAALAAMLGWRP